MEFKSRCLEKYIYTSGYMGRGVYFPKIYFCPTPFFQNDIFSLKLNKSSFFSPDQPITQINMKNIHPWGKQEQH